MPGDMRMLMAGRRLLGNKYCGIFVQKKETIVILVIHYLPIKSVTAISTIMSDAECHHLLGGVQNLYGCTCHHLFCQYP
eukprot:3637015-Rhodomonas_salina.1